VYDECEPAERQVIEEHLETCHTCRREIAGLRSVRQDLLAWSVPDHESVWRPVAPRVESPWRAVPAWAMAAAAAVILMVGAAGGAATYALLPHADVQTARASTPADVVATPASAPAVPSALEQRILALERQNAAMAERVQMIATRGTAPDVSVINAKAEDLARRVNSLKSQQDQLSDTLLSVYVDNRDIRTNQSNLARSNNLILASLVRTQGLQGFGGGQ
jgi:hypothetical protein